MTDRLAQFAELSPAKQRLLLERLRRQKPAADAAAGRAGPDASSEARTVPRRTSADDPPPLSLAQERLWLIDRLNPGSVAYNVSLVVALQGAFDLPAFSLALGDVVARHEVLRTRIDGSGDQPVQRISPARPGRRHPIPVIDLAGLDQPRDEAFDAIRRTLGRPFDLAGGSGADSDAAPLLRFVLLRLGDGDHMAVLDVHHIVTDGWSNSIVIRELAALYAAREAGGPTPLPPPPLQYGDFAVWQRRELTDERLGDLLEAETRRLDGAPQVLELPTDRPRQPADATVGAGDRAGVVRLRLPAPRAEAVERSARAAGATLFMATAAGFGAVLARLAGQSQVLLGTAVAGRRFSELESIPGFFVNTLVLRLDTGDAPTWRQFLGRVRGDSLDAFAHQDLPFARLVERLAPERSLDRNPLYQAQMVLQNAPRIEAEMGGVAFDGVEIEAQRAQMDLTLDLRQGVRGELVATLTYRAELFDATTARRMVRRFLDLLDRAAERPDAPLAALVAPAGAERHQVLHEWAVGAVAREARPAPTIRDAVAAVARRSPDAPAVESPEGRLSYGELQAAALGLAGRLARRGVSFGEPVAVWMEAGLARVVAQLALYQLGAVYLPLDPTFPEDRVGFSLEDARVRLMVAGPGFEPPVSSLVSSPVSSDTGVDLVRLGGLEELRALAATAPPPGAPVPLGPDDPAYVVYTSGSTGRPKGVVTPHRAIAAWADGFARLHRLGPGERVPHLSGPAFDASMIDLWPPLTRGATVVVPDADTRHSPEALLAWLGERGITQGWAVTPLAEALLSAMEEGGLSSVPWALHTLYAGGDRVRARPAPELPLLVTNNYGPTETTVIAIQGRVAPAGTDPRLPEIGRPTVGVTARLLDRRLEPAVLGEAGQIVLGGPGLATGYLARPAVTAEVFVPDPHPAPDDPGARVYLTGDLGRFRSDGRIDYLGRLDRQVQVRGFRIEPGEVEAALVAHPSVAEAVVVAHGEASGETVLAAYLVPAPGAADDDVAPATLAPHLERRLPPALVPALWTVLEEIPRTSTGKLDRRALPAPAARGGGAKATRVAPETPMEIYLAGVWEELLDADNVGRHDDFFHLGGHSLLATQLTSRLRRELDVDLPLRAVFEAPTLDRLAAVLDAETHQQGEAGPTPLPRPSWPAAFPLSPAQERLWFLDRMEPGLSVYNVPTVVRLEGAVEPAAMARALGYLRGRHESLRTTFDGEVTDAPRQRIHAPGGRFPLPVVDLSALPEGLRDGVALAVTRAEGYRPFDLVAGPLARGLLVREDARRHVLVLTLHHIVSDGWSQDVLMGELTVAYDADSAGAAGAVPDLPPPALQYADFAVWQRAWLAGEVLEAQVEHWREQLAGAPDLLPLPLDRPRGRSLDSAGASHRFVLDPDLLRRLGELTQATGATRFMVLMAAFQALLARLSGEGVVVVGTPIANRHRPELEPVVGFFANTLAIPGRLGDDPTFADHLARVRETVLDAFAHQDLPFARLVEELDPERSLGHHPIFQVALSTQTEMAARRRQGSLAVTPVPAASDHQPVKFDLMLSFIETEGELRGSLVYRRQLFAPETAAALVDCLVRLLDGAVDDPSRKVSELRLPASSRRLRELAAASVEAPAAIPPQPDTARRGAPKTPVERAVATLWMEVLDLDPLTGVRLEDNFFHQGGHSLLATRMVARVKGDLGVDLPIRALFENPVLADLIAEVERLGGTPRTGAPASRPAVPSPEPKRPVPVPAGRRPRHPEPDPPGTPDRGRGPSPVSFAQERLWFLYRLQPNLAAYHIPTTLRLTGPLRRDHLARAVAAVVGRHESLRTRFVEIEGVPRQVVEPRGPASARVPVIDLSALPDPSAAVTGPADRETVRPFDLETTDPRQVGLARFRLFVLGPERHQLLMVLHHVISDGWSLSLLSRELVELYGAFARGLDSAQDVLPPLPLQVSDVAVAERRRLASGELDRQLDHWRENLAGAPQVLDLPTDRPRSPVRRQRSGRASRTVFPELGRRLTELTRESNASPYMLVLAALGAVLARLAGQGEVLVGTPIAGRTREEIEGLIGCFLNTLTMRVDVSDAPSFRTLLARTRETALAAYAHQDLPFESLLEDLDVERDTSRTPLFQVLLNMINLPKSKGKVSELTIEQLPSAEVGSKFDFTLYAQEVSDGGLHFSLVYDADLFDQARMEELLAQLETFLAAAVLAPDVPIDRHSLVTPGAERLLRDPSAPLALDWSGPVHELVFRQAERHPERIAVEDDTVSWSYRELVRRASRLAEVLAHAGVSPGDVVAIEARRGATLPWGVLGTLASGAAFTLLDPAHPPARRAQVIELAGPRAVLRLEAGERPREIAAALAGLDLAVDLTLSPDDDPTAGRAGLVPALSSSPDDLAYLAFTSGSTGVPKGVRGRHASLAHFPRVLGERMGLRIGDRLTMLSGLAHDPLLRDLFVALTRGATVVVPSEETIGTPGRLAAWMAERQVTATHLTPSMGQLLAAGAEVEIPSLRWAVFGGEALRRRDVSRLRSLAPNATVVNLYGATETQQALSWLTVDDDSLESAPVLPLGPGLPGSQVLVVVFPQGGEPQLAGLGEEGEICLRSPGLAGGYLGDDELTASRFVANPFASSADGGGGDDRLYRTGDLGRPRPDGLVEPRGRRDRQVKIRGFRVEPAEVETALTEHPAVAEAVVVARPSAGDGDGRGSRLVAYLVAAAGEEIPPPAEVRRTLREKLPEYLVPAEIVTLDALPRTASGKLDHRSLPEPSAPEGPEELVAPEGLVETTIAAIWRDLLNLGKVGVHQSFFDLGGHSLLATRVAARLRDELGVELAIRTLFELPTIDRLARHVEAELDRLTAELEASEIAEAPPAGVATPVDPGVSPESSESPESSAKPPAGLPPAPPMMPLPRLQDPAVLPMSPAQRRLWFLDRLDPDLAVFNLPTSVLLDGGVDRLVLARALARVVARHETLRTRFAERGGTPVQVIRERVAVPLPVVDLSGVAAVLPEKARLEAMALNQREKRRPFDLERGPVFRALLVRIDGGEHRLTVVVHHIVSDGWSQGILIGELAEQYAALTDGRPVDLPPLPVQYGDYAFWQQSWLSGEVLERHVDHWRVALAGLPDLLPLPTDRPRPRVQSFDGVGLAVRVPPPLARRLSAFARERGASVFMVMMAAFQVLLARLSGRDELVVGTIIANRTRSEIENLIGFFVNMLALPARLGDDPAFGDHVERVRSAALDAYAHQALPFEKLVEELHPERSLSHHPVFQTVFALQNTPRSVIELPGLSFWQRAGVGTRTDVQAQLDLAARLWEAGDELVGVFEARRDLFDPTTIERWVASYLTLLQGLVSQPEAPVSHLSLLSAAQRHQMLHEWSDVEPWAVGDRSVASVPERILAALDRHRDSVAVVGADGSRLTFGQLDRRSRALAGRLIEILGPADGRERGREPVVGVLAPRSPEQVIAVLAVWRAGLAWVPLEPAHPMARHLALLTDAGARAVLVSGDLPKEAFESAGVAVLHVSRGETDDATESVEVADLVDRRPHPHSAAYVVYTSGSTGEPKGVVVPHGNLAVLFDWHERAFGVQAGERVSHLISPVFDPALQEVWPILVAGATVVVVDDETRLDLAALSRRLRAEGVRYVHTSTPMAEEMLDPDGPDLPWPSMVVTGGDRLRRTPGPETPFVLVNHYGPTETTITATEEILRPGPKTPGALEPSIGRPRLGIAALVVDRQLRPVPVGVAGELVLGGDGPVRGYLGRPAATAAAFVPDPFASSADGERAGGRLYKTGDRVRFRADGRLDFLGRIDRQVKVRGVRVELGEVEAVLAGHPRVAEVAVEVRGERSDETVLAAYLALRSGAAEGQVTAETLAGYLAERLPPAFVPAVWTVLDRLPKTPGGKIDRRALPDSSGERTDFHGERVAPRTDTERELAAVWSKLLGVPEPGVHDDFFQLGGHSLLGTRLVTEVRDRLGLEMPLRLLFERPTVAGLAAWLDTEREAGGAVSVPVESTPRNVQPDGSAEMPLSPAQRRLWFLDRLDPYRPTYNLPTAVALEGRLDVPALAAALASLARRHETLRTHFTERDRQPVQVIAPAGEAALPLPVVDLAGLSDGRGRREAFRVVGREGRTPFHLDRGPLARALLVRLAPQRHALAMTVHHIVSDGWSQGVLVRELGEVYGARVTGRAPELPKLPIQYADYAVWQRQLLSGELLATQVGWWREALAGAPNLLSLPLDRPRPRVQGVAGGRLPLVIGPRVTEGLRRLARDHDATLFMVLMAAFQALLSRWTGEGDVVTGTPIAHRTRGEIENLVGFFVNTLALVGRMDDDPPFVDHLARLREMALGAYAHQDLPFETLVEELHPERNLAHHAVFQTLFALQNLPGVAIELPEVQLTSLGAAGDDSFLAKFDLSAMMLETGDRLAGSIEYRKELFDRTTIERLARMFVRLLHNLADDPASRISELSLLGPAERHQLVHAWGRSMVPPDPAVAPGPRKLSALEAILEHAAERPDAPAVVAADDTVLTFGALVRRSAVLARHLAPFVGDVAEPLVAVLAERSPEEVVADLAAWRLGGAYLPLDPAHPDERQRMVLDDSRARVLVLGSSPAVDPELASRLAAPGRTVVALADLADLDWDADTPHDAPVLKDRPVDLHSAAYCFYTSGSTGRPKGVIVSHLALAGIVDWYVTDYPPQPGDRMGHVASPAFDPTVFDLWPALSTGGTVVSVDDDTRRDPARLLERLALSGVRYVLCPTPIAEALMDLDDFSVARGRPLRGIMSGGDQLRRRPKPEVPFDLIDVYGPVEAAVVATTGVVEEVPRRAGEQPSIGRPRPGCTARALDRWLRPVPAGVAGELVLGGDCLARGYLDQPAKTAAVFVPDPFSHRPGQRLYRTGDRVRFHADGRFDFLGRLDRQVKVRGVRIEPGEVEGALAAHPNVAEVAVVPVAARAARRGGEKVLAAYLVPQAGADPAALEPSALAAWASSRLPGALVPSLWTVLAELPKTATGKVDRRALPEPVQTLETGYRAPRTDTEKTLAEIWQRVLEVERVGVDDDFFALGGHSLLATRVVAEMREAFDREVELRLLFERPTVAALADHLVGEELAQELAAGDVADDELERLLGELDMVTTGHGGDEG